MEMTRSMSRGDEMAYRTFHSAYFDRLLRYLLVVTAGNEEAAREALQSTMIRVARHIKVFTTEETFWSWLTRLARCSLADESRKRRRYFRFLERFALFSRPFSREVGVVRKEEDTEEALRASIERHLKGLPADEQALIERKYFARQSVRQMADELQTTEKAVESKLSRVRRKLKEAVLAGLKNE